MNTNDIIEIARSAGFKVHPSGLVTVGSNADWDKLGPMLTKFAELIQARAVPEPTIGNYGRIIQRVEQLIDVGHTFWLEGADVTPEEFVHAVLIAAAQKGSV